MDRIMQCPDSISIPENKDWRGEIISEMLELTWSSFLKESSESADFTDSLTDLAKVDLKAEVVISKSFLLNELYLSLSGHPSEKTAQKLLEYRTACIHILNYAEGNNKYGAPFSFFQIYGFTGYNRSHGEELDRDLDRVKRGDLDTMSELITNSMSTRSAIRQNSRRKIVRYLLFDLQNALETFKGGGESPANNWLSKYDLDEVEICYKIIEAHILSIVETVFPLSEEVV